MRDRLIFVSFLAVLTCVANAQVRMSVAPDNTHQIIEFFGAADAWSGNFVGKYWDDGVKTRIADYLFSQETDASGNPKGIGLSIWRVNLGAGTLEQEGADIIPYQRRAESYLTVDGSGYDWSKCAGHEYFMQAAKERGCNQFILFSNSPLVQYTLNGRGYAPTDNSVNLREDCYDDFAEYLVDVTEHLMDKGFNIPYISPINEPQGDWCTPRQEGSPWKSGQIARMTRALDKSLSRSPKFDDTRIFIAEAARLSVLYTYRPKLLDRFEGDSLECPARQLFTFFDKQSPHYVADLKHMDMEFTAHPYHNHFTTEELLDVHRKADQEFKKYGVDYHSSEWCLLPVSKRYGGITEDWIPGNHGDMQASLMMARLIHSDLVDVNAVSWCYWKGMELRGDHALVALHAKDGDIHKGGYVSSNKMLWTLGNYSRFIRPGFIRVQTAGADDLDALAGSAYVSPDGKQIVAVFVNSSFTDEQVIIDIPKSWKKKILKVTSYRTDERRDLAADNEDCSLDYTVAARSVATFVFDLDARK